MGRERFVGVVDLSVRYSSMNPLKVMDIAEATKKFQKCIGEACVKTHIESEDKEGLVQSGIIQWGAREKYFEFEHFEDLYVFIQFLRMRLLNSELPFKACIRWAEKSEQLSDKWNGYLAELQDQNCDDQRAEEILTTAKRELGVDDVEKIKLVSQLYLNNASTLGSAELDADLENFKGLGLHLPVNPDLAGRIPDTYKDHFFINHYPSKKQARLIAVPFRDIRYRLESYDHLITECSQRTDNKSTRSEYKAHLNQLMKMIRRSIKASQENGTYYISALNALVCSSDFSKIFFHDAARPNRDEIDQPSPKHEINGVECSFKNTWQKYPSIFSILILSTGDQAFLKKVDGIEIVLASLLEHVYRGFEGQPTKMDEHVGDVHLDEVMCKLANVIERKYTEKTARKIYSLPESVISPQVKCKILECLS